MNDSNVLFQQPALLWLLIFWNIFWKGWALWKSANKKHLLWFVILLIFNTFGILEILYIFFLNRWDIDNGKILRFLQKQFSKKS